MQTRDVSAEMPSNAAALITTATGLFPEIVTIPDESTVAALDAVEEYVKRPAGNPELDEIVELSLNNSEADVFELVPCTTPTPDKGVTKSKLLIATTNTELLVTVKVDVDKVSPPKGEIEMLRTPAFVGVNTKLASAVDDNRAGPVTLGVTPVVIS